MLQIKSNPLFLYLLYLKISHTCISFKWLQYGTIQPCAEMSLMNPSNSNSTFLKELKYISSQFFSPTRFEHLLSEHIHISEKNWLKANTLYCLCIWQVLGLLQSWHPWTTKRKGKCGWLVKHECCLYKSPNSQTFTAWFQYK